MGSAILSALQHLWPFTLCKLDDLKTSNQIVRGLSISENTKEFVFAFREPNSQAVIYVLAVQNLSQQSALDATCLIKEVQPGAVLVQVAPSALPDFQKEIHQGNNQLNSLPTSSFAVLKECFVNKIKKEQYQNLAENQILKAIFGVEFYGHLLAAKRAAEETGSRFMLLESPSSLNTGGETVEAAFSKSSSSLLLQPIGVIPGKAVSVISSGSNRFLGIENLRPQISNSLLSALSKSMPESISSEIDQSTESGSGDCPLGCNYEAPFFAQSVYLLLADLHDIFVDLPGIKKAFLYAQKMLVDVKNGEAVDTQHLAVVHNFRIAVEGLRIGLNNAARDPKDNINSAKRNFYELSFEEKCNALLAQTLKSQTQNFSSIVAIVDASSLAGLRKHWKTSLPPEIQELVAHSFVSDDDDETKEGVSNRTRSLSKKPVVAVGAGATAVLGASSLSKVVPMSAVAKALTYNIPASLKISLAQTQRTLAIGLAKIFSSSKILAPWIGSSGTKASAMKAAASAEKIRAVAHSFVASAERSSFQAMRTSLYEIMRRRGRTVGMRPWVALGCSVVTCSSLLLHGDGIECAAESAPSAPTIASVGRGLRSLHEASGALSYRDSGNVQGSIKSVSSLQNMKHQL